MQSFTTLEFAIDSGIARITLNRPDAANSLNMDMAKDLLQTSLECQSDSSVRAVLLSGTGRMFCAGGDLKSFVDNAARLQAFIKELTTHLHSAISNFARMRAPLIIAVNGTAAGAGFSLASCGDLVLAAKSAKFTMAYTAAGLVPDGSASWYLPRVIGLRRTQELMITNRRLTAEEACDWGIVTRVVADEELAAEAQKLARQIADGPTGAYGAVKRLLRQSSENSLEQQLEEESLAIALQSVSADGREGVAAFLEKRAAEFSGN